MQIFKNINLQHISLLLLFSSLSTIQPTSTSSCGNINLHNSSSLLTNSLICKSQTLYLRTTLGLLRVSSIDYKAKTLTIPHTSCSPSLHFISPSLLSSAFPSPPQPNSLALFNCGGDAVPASRFVDNCTSLLGCKGSYDQSRGMRQGEASSSCWIVHDLERLEVGFDPKDLNCSHYARVYRDMQYGSNNSSGLVEELKLGTVVSFDVPDHIPNVCDECAKPHGNCGAGLRCICHPKDCRDKVIARSALLRPAYELVVALILLLFSQLR